MGKFVHLRVHSDHSLFEAVGSVNDIITTAESYGMVKVAITDYNTLYAVNEFIEQFGSIKDDSQLIVGCELFLRDSFYKDSVFKNSSSRIVVLCKNRTGYENLVKLLNIAWTTGFYFRPTITLEDLKQYREGLILLAGSLGSEIEKLVLRKNNSTDAEKLVKCLHDIFQDEFYLELTRVISKNDAYELENFIKSMRDKYNIDIVATNDTQRVNEKDLDKLEHALLLKFKSAEHISLVENNWMKSAEKMKAVFVDIPEAIYNTAKLCDKIENFTIDKWEHPKGKRADVQHYSDLRKVRELY